MERAVIVSTARTPIGKAYRGAFNNTDAASLGGHAHALRYRRVWLTPLWHGLGSWGGLGTGRPPYCSTRRVGAAGVAG